MLHLFDHLRIAGPPTAHKREVTLDIFHALGRAMGQE
jgi:hypothetical protein